jgi:hypothetical protein
MLVYSFTLHLEGDDDSLLEVQVVQLQPGMHLFELFDAIYKQRLDGRLRTEALIVRLPVDQSWSELELVKMSTAKSKFLFKPNRGGFSSIFDRVRDRSVHLLASSNGEHFLTGNVNPLLPNDALLFYGVSGATAVLSIRRAELAYLLEQSRAVLPSPGGSAYRAPNGVLVDRFVRVGNIQYSKESIDSLFFWLLPYLIRSDGILVDTWSISSLALNSSILLGRYLRTRPIPVSMLPHYHDGSPHNQEKLRPIVEQLCRDIKLSSPGAESVLCLISATHSGRLAEVLGGIFVSSQVAIIPNFVALFSLSPTKLPSLYDLSSDARFRPVISDMAVRKPIDIDPQIYFPISFRDEEIIVTKRAVDRYREFFDRYAGHDIIRVHYTDGNVSSRPRHHAIYVETKNLTQISIFTERLNMKLSGLLHPPIAIVSPPHPAGVMLVQHAAQYLAAVFGASPPVFHHENLYFPDTYMTAEEERLRKILVLADESASLLILDDVCITGTRLSQFQRYARTVGYRGRIDYLVGIARPPSEQVWNNLKRYLSFRGTGQALHSVDCVEIVVLPDWREDACPWCQEAALYRRWGSESNLPAFISNRLDHLHESSSTGMVADLFLRIAECPDFKLGPDSFYALSRASQADVFASVSSALQTLRTDSTLNIPLGPRRFPLATVLDYRDYLAFKWTDSILRVSFLRSATVDELVYSNVSTESEKSEMIRNILCRKNPDEHNVVLEFACASAMGKCKIFIDDYMIDSLYNILGKNLSSFLISRLT